jgi:hypothetical protein
LSDSKGDEYAACTLLYAGLAPEVRSGDWVVPWGRKGSVPENVKVCRMVREGEQKSVSERVYEWCEERVKEFR